MDHDLNQIRLYRKRLIPDETICLDKDTVLLQEDKLIVTKWNTLKSREDISRGISGYFIDENIKVSKIYNKNNQIVYWYCDIIETTYEKETNCYTFLDLLIDILVYENGQVKVVDLDELGDLLKTKVISTDSAYVALHTANALLEKIYSGNFSFYQNIINKME